jgi:CubicO group peptidase (beta-lactamase class C family)
MPARAVLLFAFLLTLTTAVRGADDIQERLEVLLDEAENLSPLQTVVISHKGRVVAERGYRGHSPARSANIKSASKSIISALVGIAIEKSLLEGTDQMIAPLLQHDLPAKPDPRLREVTIGHLLSMQAGLGRTSGANYGRWVASSNWVRAALAMPFDDEPGGAMLYSTGSTHLLSAILTRVTGRSTLELAREWLGRQEGFAISAWDRDPQGIYLGGNNMAMTPRSLLAFGELYLNGGVSRDGERLIPIEWIEASWQPRTASRFTGDGYGYGWFMRRVAGEDVYYGWGYGGQMIYVVPGQELVAAMTSDDNSPAGRSGHRGDLHALLGRVVAAVKDLRAEAFVE